MINRLYVIIGGMKPFVYIDDVIVERGVFGHAVRWWDDWESFGEFLDDGIKLYNAHLGKEPIPLYLLKDFYEPD